MAFPTARGLTQFDGGSISSPFIDSRDFDAAAVSLFQMADWIEDVEVPLQRAKSIAIQDMADRFENQVDPLGQPWTKLTSAYALEKQLAVGFVEPILTRTSDLRNAAIAETAWFVEGDSVLFNTNDLPGYWRYHQQEGGRYPKFTTWQSTKLMVGRATKGPLKGQVVKNPNHPSGKFPVKTTKFEQDHGMPQRAFIGLSVEAQAEIEYMVDQWLDIGFRSTLRSYEKMGGGSISIAEGVEDGITRKIVKGAGGKPQWHIGGKWGPMA